MPDTEPSDHREDIRRSLSPKKIGEPLASLLRTELAPQLHDVIIELNLNFPGGRAGAAEAVAKAVTAASAGRSADPLQRNLDGATHPFVFAQLNREEIYAILDVTGAKNAIFRIWESTKLRPLTTVTVRTVKADASYTAFSARGKDIVWAILDSGVDAGHAHFQLHGNLKDLPAPLVAESFVEGSSPTEDAFGHGTHVAGIIGGESLQTVAAALETADDANAGVGYRLQSIPAIRGMAPECKLLSFRVLKDTGDGDVTAVINALERVLQLNAYGENIRIHGVNISVGYVPDVRWYAAGQTPICTQVDRLVRSGVCVVVAAGNTGYVATQAIAEDAAFAYTQSASRAAQFATINDPGNAHLAITVGSTHREKPHRFGVSYFSSRGPTADGRLKPDVLAPGERVISCATGINAMRVVGISDGTIGANDFGYVEDTGTSMSAPHVSGIIAGFLSVRREFIGEALDVRDMIIASATDLGRDARMQGAGLVDAMRLFTSS